MKPTSNVDITVDSWETLVNRVNVLAKALSDEIVTANSSLGETTGNARVTGNVSANVLVATSSIRGGNNTTAATLNVSSVAQFLHNTAHLGITSFQNNVSFGGNVTITTGSVIANGSPGTAGQILTSNGTTVAWANPATISSLSTLTITGSLVVNAGASLSANGGVGTNGQILYSNGTSIYWDDAPVGGGGGVEGVYAGVGLTGNVTSNGTISVLANNGIIANTSGVFLDLDYAGNNIVVTSTLNSNNSSYLLGATWASPGAIGSGTANTGAFTTLAASGKATFMAANATTASINLPHGSAPSSLVNGDFWTRTTGAFIRIDGTSYQIATLTGSETFSSKTLTAPTINGGSIHSTNMSANNTVNDNGTVGASSPGFRGIPQLTASSNRTLALNDAGKHISITSGTVTIPANASIAFPVGTTIVIFNNASSTRPLAITSDTLRLGGTTSTGSRTIAAYGLISLVKVASTTWVVSGHVT